MHAKACSADIRIGIAGWRYEGGRRTFYPQDLPQKKELGFAAQHFNSIEPNGSFYSLQRPKSYQSWSDETPDDFVFSIQGAPLHHSHAPLREVKRPIANFCAQGILRLGNKLGPILWRLPPTFKFEEKPLENFFNLLPRTGEEAAYIGAKHDQWMKEH